MRLRSITVAALAGLLMLSGTGAAFAAQEAVTEAAVDLDTVKERVLERISNRIARFERVVEELEGEAGVVPEQKVALATEGIAIFTAAAAEVEEAETAREVLKAFRKANREYEAHQMVRRLYTHVQLDLYKFARRLDRLDTAIDRAEGAGFDVTEAAEASAAAAVALASAQEMLDVVDPSATGSEVVDALKAAHRTAHSGQQSIRHGWRALWAALGE
jgi:CheY-like chemotaxis protein